MKQARSESALANQLADASFSKLGFSLDSDPCLIYGRYTDSWVMYRLKDKPLFLKIAFQPSDSRIATITFGRVWFINERHYDLSNKYSVLAKIFNFDISEYYKLDYGDANESILEKMLNDLMESLDIVSEKVTPEDILQIENIDGGMQLVAIGYFGMDYAKHVRVSSIFK